MKIIRSVLGDNIPVRTEKDYPVKGVEFIDIMPLITTPEVYRNIINALTADAIRMGADIIIAPEARGFLLGSAMSCILNIPIVPVRKKGKLAPSTVECEIVYLKEYAKDYLCLPKLFNDSYAGKKAYIVDDIYATGGTVKAIKDSLTKLGATVVGTGVIMNIIELNNDRDVFSLIDINEENN